MSSLEEIRQVRLEKLKKLIDAGIDPFPAKTQAALPLKKILDSFSEFKKQNKSRKAAGRVMAVRGHGGSAFVDLYDGSARLQIFLKKDELGVKNYNLFKETIDVGDFCEFAGKLFITKKKEKSLLASSWRMLSKSLRPLPEKWHGLQDIEERFRKRYLDLLMNAEIKERFLLRSKIIKFIREYLDKESFVAVETPILQNQAGGALAKPFITHHNALDIDLYLRIAPELYLKRLLVGSFQKVYELGRNFRNEGIDATHNPEFTMLEVYEAYKSAKDHRAFVEKFLKALVKGVFKKPAIKYQGKTISFSKKFKVIEFKDILKQYALINDYENTPIEELVLKARQFGADIERGSAKGKVADEIFKKVCRPKIIQPTFITGHPLDISPLAKSSADNEKVVDRYQLIVGGLEIVNGFSELNNPLEQKKRFEDQQKMHEKGDKEAAQMDEDFLEAMEYGMPPAAGFGIGIDRLTMLLTDTKNIREVVLFPTMRPKN